MLDLEKFAGALSDAAKQGLEGGAGRICELCVRALPIEGAAISVMSDVNRREIVYATDEIAHELELLQFSLGEGPCIEAFTTGRSVLVADLNTAPDSRWPMFGAAAARTSARGAYAFPLQVGVISVGVLDLYGERTAALRESELSAALMAADAVVWSLLGLRAGIGSDAAPDGARWLPEGRRAHSVVHQATGMIMAQADKDAETALAKLRAFAFVRGRLIDDVAVDVVARRLRFDEEDD